MENNMLLNELSNDIWYCSTCMMCKAVCTVHRETRKEAHSPMKRVWLLDMIRRGILEFDKKSVELMYEGCLLCRLCTEWCVSRQDIANIMATARADIVNLGKAPKYVLKIDHNFEFAKNPTGEPFEKRFAYLQMPKNKEVSDIVYFVGCTTAYYRPEIAKAMQKILEAAEINYTVLDEEYCCGLPAYELGLRERARELAKHNAKVIKDTKVKTVVASCPSCARALKLEYERWGISLDVNVLHHTELIDLLLKEGKLKLSKPLNSTLVYHDPCHLGRYLQVYDAPRNVLIKIPQVKLVEMWRNREKASCCGAGGGYRLTHPETAIKIAERVVDEAIRTSAEILVTACPTCKLSFMRPAETKKELVVRDIAEIVADAIS